MIIANFKVNVVMYDGVIGFDLYCSVAEWPVNGVTHMPDVLPPVHSSEDWQAAFGFPPGQDDHELVRMLFSILEKKCHIFFLFNRQI